MSGASRKLDVQHRAKRIKFFSVKSVQWLALRANPRNPCYSFVPIRSLRRELDGTIKRPYTDTGLQGVAQ
jgi:hypothetical protein